MSRFNFSGYQQDLVILFPCWKSQSSQGSHLDIHHCVAEPNCKSTEKYPALPTAQWSFFSTKQYKNARKSPDVQLMLC